MAEWTLLISLTVFVLWQPFTIYAEVYHFLVTGRSMEGKTPTTWFLIGVYIVNFVVLGCAVASWYWFIDTFLPGDEHGVPYDVVNGIIFAAVMITKLYPVAFSMYSARYEKPAGKNVLKLIKAHWMLIVAFLVIWAALVVVFVLFGVYSQWLCFGLWSPITLWATILPIWAIWQYSQGKDVAGSPLLSENP